MPIQTIPEAPAEHPASESVLADLARYAAQTAALDEDAETSLVGLQRREREELDAVRARFAVEAKAVQAARGQKLQAWAALPGNREAIERLAQEGGDAATIRSASAALVSKLVASGLAEAEAKAVVERLAAHPLRPRWAAQAHHDGSYGKTDPLRGAIDTVKHLDRHPDREAQKPGL